jgi:phage baseplate assembly protein W
MANGIGITLPIQLGSTGYFEQAFNVITQLKSNFINLILTKKGERLHQPTFGCNIHRFIFEHITPENNERIRLSIIDAVEEWMPFLELLRMDVVETDIENKIQLYITYRLRNNPNIQDSIILTF